MKASIILCTRNRADMLEGCLGSILDDSSKADRELLIVDNGSTDGTRALAQRFLPPAASTIPVRYLRVEQPGKSHALNAAIQATKGDPLLFVDDDVLVQDGWADALIRGFADPSVGAVGGRVLPQWPFDPPRWLRGPHATLLTLYDHGPESRRFGTQGSELPTGANMAVRHDLLRQVDSPFPPSLGPRSGMKIDGEEWYLLEEIAKTHVLFYSAEAVVYHRIEPERINWDWMRRVYFQRGIGLGRIDRLRGEPLADLPRRIVRPIRSLRAAARLKKQGRASSDPSPEHAEVEFWNYVLAGRDVELLLGRFPTVTDWLARHVV